MSANSFFFCQGSVGQQGEKGAEGPKGEEVHRSRQPKETLYFL